MCTYGVFSANFVRENVDVFVGTCYIKPSRKKIAIESKIKSYFLTTIYSKDHILSLNWTEPSFSVSKAEDTVAIHLNLHLIKSTNRSTNSYCKEGLVCIVQGFCASAGMIFCGPYCSKLNVSTEKMYHSKKNLSLFWISLQGHIP